MSVRYKPLPQLQGAQAQAADPSVHASLSASAGSGKTQVLTARVLRLLLTGVDPEHILCLTFTKAGAAEMANRIGNQLAAWVRLPDKLLKKELFALGEANDPTQLERARRLFAKVLDAPGGLRIQTIHSFAQALLGAFPAEAGITAGFEPIEGRAEQELARSTLARLLADAEAQGEAQLISDVQCLSLRLGEDGATRYLMHCAHAAEDMGGLGAPEKIELKLRAMMGLPEGAADDFLAEHCGDDRFDCDLLRAIADANRRWGTSTGAGLVERVERWLAMDPANRAAALPDLALVVFTGSGDIRKVSAGQRKADEAYEAHTDRLANAISELLKIQAGSLLAADMAAGLRAGQAFAAAYTSAKRSAGVADFNDLIAWSRRLLAEPGMGDWVRYKLDRRTDHILIDESQDTNAAQWEIVKALADEFFSGAGAAGERHRTMFMVGDFKQAIFRFQGTDPQEFKRARDWVRDNCEGLRSALDEAGEDRPAPEFRELSIDRSFRSAQAVLDVVDATIDEVGYPNMGLPEAPHRHRAHFADRPGLVELWRPFSAASEEDREPGEEGWLGEDERLYAADLARQVRCWLAERPLLHSTGRELTPGDVLILVRSRGELASLIVARLFAERVPVAGIDRLHLHKPLAVRDLLAAVGFAVQPLDDLTLANLLVSPLLGWSQDQLRELAFGRDKKSLWDSLRKRAGERPEFQEARTILGSLLAMTDYTTPHQFLETILSGPVDGRSKLYSRLGVAARDPIDELLSSALEFERNEVASLDRFLAWFARGDVEIKRDPSAPANVVRVMTVHGAKGLEAPLVVLADCTTDAEKIGGVARDIDLPISNHRVPVIRPRKTEQLHPFDTIIEADKMFDLQEHWRLLYVGMTRAIDRLVIAGIDKGAPSENCWHTRVERALVALGAHWEGEERPVLRYRGSVSGGPIKRKPAPIALPISGVPHWARSPAPPEARPPRPLAPSAMVEDRESSGAPSAAMRAATERGTMIHALLERLPPLDPAHREDAALRWLERSAGLGDAASRREITTLVCELLANPRFAPLFGPNSLAEAPIAATLADGRVIAGTVDRLLIGDDRVIVVDYKTGRVPATDSQIPASHREQMNAYAQALSVIFPDRTVSAALLYTGSGALFELAG